MPHIRACAWGEPQGSVLPDVLTCAPSSRRDRDYHLKTYKSVLPGSKLVDWLLAQVSCPPAHGSCTPTCGICPPWTRGSSLLTLPSTKELTGLLALKLL